MGFVAASQAATVTVLIQPNVVTAKGVITDAVRLDRSRGAADVLERRHSLEVRRFDAELRPAAVSEDVVYLQPVRDRPNPRGVGGSVNQLNMTIYTDEAVAAAVLRPHPDQATRLRVTDAALDQPGLDR